MSYSQYPYPTQLSEIKLENPNGYGSVGTCIRRYTTVVYNTGTDMVYLDSSTNGMSITVVTPGLYAVATQDQKTTAGVWNSGVSYNSNQLSTALPVITTANILACAQVATGTNFYTFVIKICVAGDVLRIHQDGTANTTGVNGWAHIIKVSN